VTNRFIRSCIFLLALSAAAASAADVTIAHVFTGWRDASSFKRISEYFTGRENTGGQTVLRSQPSQRAGFYFLVRAENTGAPTTAQVVVNLIMPIGKQVRTHTFTTSLSNKETLLNLGITGSDWLDPKTNPVAWKIDIVSADGRMLASEKSYLWDKPVGE